MPQPLLALDTETTGIDFWNYHAPFAVSICQEYGDPKIWEWPVDPSTRTVVSSLKDQREIQTLLNTHTVVFHNAVFDLQALASIDVSTFLLLGFREPSGYEDVLLAAHVCRNIDSHKLKELALLYLNMGELDEQDLLKEVYKGRDLVNRAKRYKLGQKAPPTLQGQDIGWLRSFKLGQSIKEDYWIPKALNPASVTLRDYALNDAERTLNLWYMYRQVMEREGLTAQYREQLSLVPVILEMELRGIRLLEAPLEEQLFLYRAKRGEAEDTLKAMSHDPNFNVRSHRQVGRFIYEGIQPPLITSTGQPCTSNEALQQVPGEKAKMIMQYRKFEKAVSYLESYRNAAVESSE